MSDKENTNCPTSKRVQLDMNSKALSDLNQLKVELEATTYAEVVRRLMKLFLHIIMRKKDGAKFFIKEKDGTLVEIFF